MSYDNELLGLNRNIRFYTSQRFDKIPAEPGIYAWFYPLRLKGTNLKRLIEEVNYVFNFCKTNPNSKNPKIDFKMGWRQYSLESKFDDNFPSNEQIESWDQLINTGDKNTRSHNLEQIKKIIFVSSIFMPPLYVGKTCNLWRRCSEHVRGATNAECFNKRFNEFMKQNEMIQYQTVDDLIFACISTKQFGLDENKYENLFESVLMNVIKPIFSLK